MRRLGSVQQKIPCVFLTEVREEPSRKRDCQFQVVATENVNPVALESNINCALATEKLDGTCCYVTTYKGEPYLWARLDRKPTKQADKRFKKYQYSQKTCKGFTWNVEEDFRAVPDSWVPAHRVQHEHGHPVPDEHGHIPGWVPVEKTNKQYCWHASVVNYEAGLALVLRPHPEDEGLLEIASVPLSKLMEQTLELIGTNVNGNPYGLGSKKHPVHVLVPHGILRVRNTPPVEYQQLYSWFQECHEGRVEGIVWHCNDGTLIKVHRYHLGLKWPDGDTFLNSRPVVVHVDRRGYDPECLADSREDLFSTLSSLNGQHFNSLRDIQFEG
ncbi:RNA ligase 1 isoform X2 [Salminus brasiliensis]|uniref:RNA ligase 1 isoform X2 n=1 Tax=Salminus brasiliensis TaxID=930266 RepID=UPI003B82EB41